MSQYPSLYVAAFEECRMLRGYNQYQTCTPKKEKKALNMDKLRKQNE